MELSAKPLSLLLYIAMHRDRVVPKQELFDELWPDVVVGEAALSSALKDLRRALGDDGVQMRFIRTFRRRGYRFVADVTSVVASTRRGEASRSDTSAFERFDRRTGFDRRDGARSRASSAVPLPDQPLVPLPFAGRDEELQSLREALSRAESGHPSLRLIEGDAGSGKTRLVDEFIARDCGFVDVVTGRARADAARPYLAFVEAFSAWMAEREVGLEELAGNESLTVTRLLHPSRIEAGDGWRSRPIGERERSELFASFANTVIGLARRQPAVLVLEDLQWADVSTLTLLEHLALAIGEAARHEPVPLLILVTARREPNTESDVAFRRILRDEHCDRLTLAGLPESAVADLIEDCGFENPPRSWVSSVAEASGGNPLFIMELTRRLRVRGEHGLELPETLEAALGERLAELSEECREVLAVASLIGDSFGLLALSAACDQPEAVTRKLLEQASAAGIIQGTRRAFRFEQRSWIHLLKAGLAPERRRALHGKLADVLEDLYASAGGEHAIEIASHLLAASDASDSERFVRYARLAGEQSLAMYAWREAGRFFAVAAESALTMPTSDRAGLHLRAGIAFNHDWDAESCTHHYQQAAASYRQCQDRAGLAWALMYLTRARLTLASASYGEEIDVDELAAIAAGLGPSEGALRAMLLELLSEVAWISGDSERSRQLAEEALVIGHNLEHDEVCHHACMGLGLSRSQTLHVREALESWRDAHGHARALGATWLAVPAAAREAMALVQLGRFAEAEAALDDALAMARRSHNLGELSFASAHRAALRAGRGDFEGALQASDESLNMMKRSRYPWGGPFAVLASTVAHVMRGEERLAREGLRALSTPRLVFENPGPAILLLVAVADLWIDGWSSASIDRTRLANLSALVASAGRDAYLLGPACALVDVAERNGCMELVTPLHPLLRLAHDRGIRFSTGWVMSIDRLLAALAVEMGDRGEAVRFIRLSIERTAQVQALPEMLLAQAMFARLGEDDPAIAMEVKRAHAESALALAQQIQSPPLVEHCLASGESDAQMVN